jgi:hypothetical protein
MTGHLSDDELMRVLKVALEAADAVPEHALAAAREILSPSGFEAELAELVFDSAVDGLVGVRSVETARQVTFRAPGVEIEIMMMAEGGRRLIGQLVPPQTATIELHFDGQVRETGTDNLGRFQFSDVPTGSIQLAIATQGGGRIITEWMVI